MFEVYQAELATKWQQLTGAQPPENYLNEYYPRIDESEFEALGPGTLAATALEHFNAGRGYSGDDPVISVHNPTTEEPAYSGNRTQIMIVMADVRHLVASLTAQLSGAGYLVRRVHHPSIVTLRDPQDPSSLAIARTDLRHTDTSALPLLTPLESGDARKPTRESWVFIEVDRITDDEFGELRDTLAKVIEFVCAASDDADAMVARAHAEAAKLRAASPRSELAGEAERAAEFLDWLDGRFTFMGYREYRLVESAGITSLEPIEGSGLGISALRPAHTSPLSKSVAAHAKDPHVLVLTKANSRSRIMRRGFMDYIGVKVYDEQGEIVGEKRFVGLYTAPFYNSSVLEIPLIKSKVEWVLQHSGLTRDSHSGSELVSVLETFPRDDLLQAPVEDVLHVALTVIDLQEKRESSVFIRRDMYERYVSVLVYVPRDLYDTESRLRVESVLRDFYRADSVDFDVLLSDSSLARLHYVARVGAAQRLPDISEVVVADRIKSAVRSWSEDVKEYLAPSEAKLSSRASARARLWGNAFPADYKSAMTPHDAVADVARFEELVTDQDPLVRIHRDTGSDEYRIRLALYRLAPAGLSDILPHLSNLGARILDEHPYRLDLADGTQRYIYDFGLEFSIPITEPDFQRVEDAFATSWRGIRETSALDVLVVAGLDWTELTVLQALASYLRQAGVMYTSRNLAGILRQNSELTGLLVSLFNAKFDPSVDAGARPELLQGIHEEIDRELGDVSTLDADRLIRALLAVIDAMVRTNMFQAEPGTLPATLAFKIRPRELSFAPKPKPEIEVWVYSPEVEGVHLRFGKVARGGLRWSDRPDDFRTEVLGLVKAQMVKNALIVPTGAKGGFVPKRLPDPATDKAGWAAGGQRAYELFINALLDVTDNLAEGDDGQTVVHPENTVRHDDDDTYLVVAADKGTARFSDVANGIAERRGFWLGDAFASGGSVGYDHKAMGITSRGAWKSVERHFRELGVNTAAEDFTAVGIGDMSGDVFGNGMLRSEHTRLVAAFDHRDIFIDPQPQAAPAYAERKRLFELPGSSWQDYDTSLLSTGGGVYSRKSKSVLLSTEAAEALGMSPGRYTPAELIKGILRAPVDLLYNGGIGTYIRSSLEPDSAAGDKTNEDIRVTGDELRVRVVGEGGNLGATQLGRIQAALSGVRINTDAVDNSAGVDCSDHEVNIKLLLDTLIRSGTFSQAEREPVLMSLTDEVADLVLANNYSQNAVLGEDRDEASAMTGTLTRLQRFLEQNAGMDSDVEFLPDMEEMTRRVETGSGFTSPELAVLLAYVKMETADELLSSDVPDESFMAAELTSYFPASLAKYSDQFSAHPLAREIATAKLVNRLVDRSGLTYIFRIIEETGARVPQIARAFAAITEIFDLDAHFDAISALDNKVDSKVQVALVHEYVRMLDRASRWLLNLVPGNIDVPATVERFKPTVKSLRGELLTMLRADDRGAIEDHAVDYVVQGVPADLAWRSAGLLDEFTLLDITLATERTGADATDVAEVYAGVTDLLRGHAILNRIGKLERTNRWTALARGALRDDFYQAVHSIVAAVFGSTTSKQETAAKRSHDRIAQWQVANETALGKVRETTNEILALEDVGQAPMSVVLRMMRSIVESTVWQTENP